MREIKYMMDEDNCLTKCPDDKNTFMGQSIMINSEYCNRSCEFFIQHSTDHSIICNCEEDKDAKDNI